MASHNHKLPPVPNPSLFEHLQWKPGMPIAEKRVRELGSQRSEDLGSPLTGETITLLSGLVVSKSSYKSLSLSEAVAYATARNGYLQTADLAMLVRDELDLHPLEKQDGTTDLDFSDQGQVTSTLCLFHNDGVAGIRMYVSDLYTMYGANFAKHQEAAEQIKQGITLPFNHDLCALLTSKAGNRNAILPNDFFPLPIIYTDLPMHPVCKAIFPAQSQRFADYLQRKPYTHANFFLIGSRLPELDDPTQCLVRPLRFGGDVHSVYSLNAVVYFSNLGRVRWVGQNFFEA